VVAADWWSILGGCASAARNAIRTELCRLVLVKHDRRKNMSTYDPNDPKQLSNWFDPHDPVHVWAFQEMSTSGSWPQSFLDLMEENGIVIDPEWWIIPAHKLAKCWVEHLLGSE
jgi:hypothetical protein